MVGYGEKGFDYGTIMDLQPGRCRRNDGKRWRCRKDANVNQKYCELHMHRGRGCNKHPRKAVESSEIASRTAAPINPSAYAENSRRHPNISSPASLELKLSSFSQADTGNNFVTTSTTAVTPRNKTSNTKFNDFKDTAAVRKATAVSTPAMARIDIHTASNTSTKTPTIKIPAVDSKIPTITIKIPTTAPATTKITVNTISVATSTVASASGNSNKKEDGEDNEGKNIVFDNRTGWCNNKRDNNDVGRKVTERMGFSPKSVLHGGIGISSSGFDHRSGTASEVLRCRRTDGKRWRCKNEVVPNQKYCVRHMHRGRQNRAGATHQNSIAAAIVGANEAQLGLRTSSKPASAGLRISWKNDLALSIPESHST